MQTGGGFSFPAAVTHGQITLCTAFMVVFVSEYQLEVLFNVVLLTKLAFAIHSSAQMAFHGAET